MENPFGHPAKMRLHRIPANPAHAKFNARLWLIFALTWRFQDAFLLQGRTLRSPAGLRSNMGD